jgi:hypothetical protein
MLTPSRIALGLSLAAALCGCADISMTAVDTHDRVLSRRKEVVPSSSVRVRSRLAGTTLFLQTTQGCDLVEMEEVQRTEILEADEDPTEELVVLGLSTVPLVSGIILLADAPAVYDDDRNSRLYNPVGKTGAYVGGTILTSVGGILALVPTIELLRIAAASEEREEILSRTGARLAGGVPCEGPPVPVRASVVLRLAGADVHTVGTDDAGMLEIDLVSAIPPELAQRATTVQVLVADQMVGELEVSPILDAQREAERAREAEAWKRADPARCDQAPPEDRFACRGVSLFLQQFPDGFHAEEARELLRRRGVSPPPTIATDDEQEASEHVLDEAREQLERERQTACARACEDACEHEPPPPKGMSAADAMAACTERCEQEVCP